MRKYSANWGKSKEKAKKYLNQENNNNKMRNIKKSTHDEIIIMWNKVGKNSDFK